MCERCGCGFRTPDALYAGTCACGAPVCGRCKKRDEAAELPVRCARCIHAGPPDEFDRAETTNKIADAPPWARRFA